MFEAKTNCIDSRKIFEFMFKNKSLRFRRFGSGPNDDPGHSIFGGFFGASIMSAASVGQIIGMPFVESICCGAI